MGCNCSFFPSYLVLFHLSPHKRKFNAEKTQTLKTAISRNNFGQTSSKQRKQVVINLSTRKLLSTEISKENQKTQKINHNFQYNLENQQVLSRENQSLLILSKRKLLFIQKEIRKSRSSTAQRTAISKTNKFKTEKNSSKSIQSQKENQKKKKKKKSRRLHCSAQRTGISKTELENQRVQSREKLITLNSISNENQKEKKKTEDSSAKRRFLSSRKIQNLRISNFVTYDATNEETRI